MSLSDLDLDAISRALDDHDPDREHFLDLRDGSLWTFVFSESTDETRKRLDEVRSGLGAGHVRIPSMTTQEAYEEIEDFVEGTPDPALRDSLFRALERKGSSRNFREVLLGHPDEHRRWRAFRRNRSRQRLEAFLAAAGLDPTAMPARGPA